MIYEPLDVDVSRRTLLASVATVATAGCASGGDHDPIVRFENLDSKRYDLRVRIRGSDNQEFVHEFEADLRPGERLEADEPLDLDRLDGAPFTFETRIDDEEPREHRVSSGFVEVIVRIQEGGDISFIKTNI